jgi:hypothetical protein
VIVGVDDVLVDEALVVVGQRELRRHQGANGIGIGGHPREVEHPAVGHQLGGFEHRWTPGI